MPLQVETYEPTGVLKPLAPGAWLVDGPVITFKGVPFPTRMTLFRLNSGDLFIHSPVELSADLKTAVEPLGRVRHLVSPNRIHYWWIDQWAQAWPDTVKWASPGAREAARKQGWDFDQDLPERGDAPWSTEIEHLRVRGSRVLEEVVFFHRPTRTLVLADLIENIEPGKARPAWFRGLLRLAGNLDPDGKLPIDLRMSYLGRKQALREAVETMISWNPHRVIMSHGRWYPENGVEELKRAFRWVL